MNIENTDRVQNLNPDKYKGFDLMKVDEPTCTRRLDYHK